MRRSLFKGAFLLVEGEKDFHLYSSLIDEGACKIVNARNKWNAVNAILILERDGYPGALAIVDADFDLLEGTSPASPNILLTDWHDLEIALIVSPAFDSVLAELASQEKIKNVGERSGGGVREMVFRAAQPIGTLRWLSERE